MKHKVIPSHKRGMYRIQYPDGVLSADHYNLSNAKEHCRILNERQKHVA